ncbi:MAG: response regulator transcription factor [Myxococcales bacterium]|nr:response regulator transcription factor [Myxococcales bacterium]
MQAATHKPRQDRLRILLVDDHPVVLAGLKSFLRDAQEVEVVGSATNVEDAARRAGPLQADVFLVALAGPAAAPLEAARQLKGAFPAVAVVVLGLNESVASEGELAAAGVSAFLGKGSGREVVLGALQALRNDGQSGSRRIFATGESVPPPSSGSGSLSRRELQVLTLIADGFTNKQIADELGISVRTVETHRERLMRKLNVQGTAALTKAAITLGLVSTKT